MGPHGGSMPGAGHSHDPEFPDDDWNLYSMLDVDATRALNITVPANTLAVFKPFARRLNPEPFVLSDADSEVIFICVFTSPVTVRKIMVIGAGEDAGNRPICVRLFPNRADLDFNNAEDTTPAQEFDLPINAVGTAEMLTNLPRFSNITSLALYFTGNYGDTTTTAIQYIGLQGDHSHYRREPVHTTYEVLCNGQDVEHTESTNLSHHLH